jgi:hypothetical protein
MLHGEITVVDEPTTGQVWSTRETVDQRREFGIAQFDPRE